MFAKRGGGSDFDRVFAHFFGIGGTSGINLIQHREQNFRISDIFVADDFSVAFVNKLWAFRLCSPREDAAGNGTRIIGLYRLANSKIELEPARETTISASAIRSFSSVSTYSYWT